MVGRRRPKLVQGVKSLLCLDGDGVGMLGVSFWKSLLATQPELFKAGLRVEGWDVPPSPYTDSPSALYCNPV